MAPEDKVCPGTAKADYGPDRTVMSNSMFV